MLSNLPQLAFLYQSEDRSFALRLEIFDLLLAIAVAPSETFFQRAYDADGAIYVLKHVYSSRYCIEDIYKERKSIKMPILFVGWYAYVPNVV